MNVEPSAPPLVGQRLGRYSIVAPLGSGGMGDVYRASDEALGRSVALKVLRPRLLSTPGLRGRLEDEARAASALNHPNIVTVYEIGRDGNIDFIASEFVEGETLASRLRSRGALPLRELIDIAIQVAAALEAAHAAGIVHRDVKPDNVMLRPDGLVKVVDFGLAKTVDPHDSVSQASTVAQAVPVAGTLCYMSPEQALGERIDRRTDLFSLGVVLYEMATGQRPFKGRYEAVLYDALLHHSPPAPSSLRPTLPAEFDLVIGRALEKDRALRHQSAADLAADLKRLQRPSVSAEKPSLSFRRRSTHRLWQGATLLALAACAGLAAMLWFRQPASSGIDAQFTLGPPPAAEFSLSGTIVPAMTLTVSPGGEQIAYLAGPPGERPRLWLRPLNAADAVPLEGTEGATYPFWSPDGRSLAFFAGTSLKRLELSDGAVRTLATGVEGRGGTWGRDGTILFGLAEGSIVSVSSAGGTPTPVTSLETERGEIWHRFPQLLPDGQHLLYLVRTSDGRRTVQVSSRDGGDTRELLETEVRATYAAPGYLLYMSEGVLLARRFDLRRLQLSGDPVQVAASVATSSAQDASYAVSETGVLAYAPRARAPGRLTWLDRAGRAVSVVGDVQDYLGVRRSPDGRTVAVTRVDASSDVPDLWLLDVARGVSSRFTFDPWIDLAPAWSPDSTTIVFASSRLGRFQFFRRVAAGGPAETLFYQSDLSKYPDDWSADGRHLVFSTDSEASGYDLSLLRVADLQVSPLVATRFNETQGRLSPDGRWLAYTTDATGRREVRVRDFPSGVTDLQVSNDGGSEPVWRDDGRELFYLTDEGRLVAVEVRGTGRTFEPGPPRVLFQTATSRPRVPYITRYSVAADGQRFLFSVPVGDVAPPPITVQFDWRKVMRAR